jgi:hypothetical protein
MKRTFVSLALALVASLALATATFAKPRDEPASCAGYLSAWANPNNGFIIQELVRPLADELDVTVGSIRSSIGQEHFGSLEACIP